MTSSSFAVGVLAAAATRLCLPPFSLLRAVPWVLGRGTLVVTFALVAMPCGALWLLGDAARLLLRATDRYRRPA